LRKCLPMKAHGDASDDEKASVAKTV
jgi:hypothetical protein